MDEVMNKELTIIHHLSIYNMAKNAADLDEFLAQYEQMLKASGICVPEEKKRLAKTNL